MLPLFAAGFYDSYSISEEVEKKSVLSRRIEGYEKGTSRGRAPQILYPEDIVYKPLCDYDLLAGLPVRLGPPSWLLDVEGDLWVQQPALCSARAVLLSNSSAASDRVVQNIFIFPEIDHLGAIGGNSTAAVCGLSCLLSPREIKKEGHVWGACVPPPPSGVPTHRRVYPSAIGRADAKNILLQGCSLEPSSALPLRYPAAPVSPVLCAADIAPSPTPSASIIAQPLLASVPMIILPSLLSVLPHYTTALPMIPSTLPLSTPTLPSDIMLLLGCRGQPSSSSQLSATGIDEELSLDESVCYGGRYNIKYTDVVRKGVLLTYRFVGEGTVFSGVSATFGSSGHRRREGSRYISVTDDNEQSNGRHSAVAAFRYFLSMRGRPVPRPHLLCAPMFPSLAPLPVMHHGVAGATGSDAHPISLILSYTAPNRTVNSSPTSEAIEDNSPVSALPSEMSVHSGIHLPEGARIIGDERGSKEVEALVEEAMCSEHFKQRVQFQKVQDTASRVQENRVINLTSWNKEKLQLNMDTQSKVEMFLQAHYASKGAAEPLINANISVTPPRVSAGIKTPPVHSSPVVETASTAQENPAGCIRGMTILVAEDGLETYCDLMLEMQNKYDMVCLDAPLDPPIDVIVDVSTAVSIISEVLFEQENRHTLRSWLKLLTNNVFKFDCIYVIIVKEEATNIGFEGEFKLRASLMEFPNRICIRQCVRKDLGYFLSRICTECAVSVAVKDDILLSQYVQNTAVLHAISDRFTCARCEFLQMFPSINMHLALVLLSHWPLRQLVSFLDADVKYICRELKLESIRPRIVDFIKISHCYCGLILKKLARSPVSSSLVRR